MKYQRFLLIIALVAIFVFLIFFFFGRNGSNRFSREASSCNSIATEFRFSCYRAILEKHYSGNLEGYLQKIENDTNLNFKVGADISYAIFGTNCHTFYHALGDFVATYDDDKSLETLLAYGPGTCTAGYTMGLYKRIALKNYFSTDVLKKFYEVCKPGEHNQCVHEIGHLLHDKYTSALLKVIDDISLKEYSLQPPTAYNYVTFEKADLNAPFEECEEIISEEKGNLLAQCFTGIGHNMFIFSEFSPDGYEPQFKACEGVEEENRDNCFAFLLYRIGINEAATRFLSNDFKKGNEVCSKAISEAGRDDLMFHCYVGIGGGIGLFIDSEYAVEKITDENLVQVKQQLLAFAKLCEKSKDPFVDNCFAGLFGTRFVKLYDLLNIYYERIEALRPNWDTDFEVVG